MNDFIWKTNGTFHPQRLQETFATNLIGLTFQRFEFMMEPYDRKILQLIESGLMAKFIRDNSSVYSTPIPNDDPAVLTLNDLSVGFKVWLFFVAIAIFSFILERTVFVSLRAIRRICAWNPVGRKHDKRKISKHKIRRKPRVEPLRPTCWFNI